MFLRKFHISRPFALAMTALAVMAVHCFSQTTTTGIHGIVRDPSGSVVPKAALKLRDMGTGLEQKTTSTGEGNFAFANLQAAVYRLTVTVPGFQTAVYDNISVDTGRTKDVAVQMSLGSVTETVQVSASGDQLATTTNEVGTTISSSLIQDLPYNGREALSFALLMAGNSNANDSSGRNSTFNGLPNASMNITVDGMNNNSQRFKSGGTSFFEFAPSRIDAVEEVTVSTTGLGADAGGEGAMNIRMTTKRGTDQYHGKVVEQFYNEDLNANSFFNNLRGIPRPRSRQNNVAGSIGGPLIPFSSYFRHKLFFFAYFEAIPQPGSQTSTANVLGPDALNGLFTYIGTDGAQRSVSLLKAAGAAGFTSTIDPTIGGLLSTISGYEKKGIGYLPVAGQPFWRTLQWTQPNNFMTVYPTARLDYQITPGISWHGTWNLRHQTLDGTAPYPGSPYAFGGLVNGATGYPYRITTYVATNSVDWTISPALVNSFSFGVQSNGEYFYPGADSHQYAPQGNRILNLPLINPVIPGTNYIPTVRNNPVYQATDNVTWVRGKHTITMGGTLLHTSFWESSYGSAGVLNYNFGVSASDPVATVLQSALPAINTGNGDITNAQNLYALLTGRLTNVTTSTNVDEKTHQYNQFAPVTQRFAFTTGGLYAQDSFRMTPNLTVNYGLRWQFDGAIHSTNGIDSAPTGANFYGPSNGPFQPGVLSGNNSPVFTQVSSPYKRDFRNPAPNLGFSWNPARPGGWAGKLVGDHKTVLRASASMTFYNEGMNSISNPLSGGRGTTQSLSINSGVQFAPGTLNLSSPLPAASVNPASFSFPLAQSAYTYSASGYSGNLVDPNIVSPYTSNWTIGVQRQLPARTLLEVRYVGNKSTHLWHYQNLQETNIFENGFLGQFKQAQQNLAINQANGKGNTFANNGLTGQGALPIFDAAFGANGANNGVVASGSGYGSSSFITNLQQGTAGTMAQTLATTTTYFCRLAGSGFSPCGNLGFNAPGQYPLNFFQANPFLNATNYQTSNGDTNYNGLQIQLSHSGHGLYVGANYTWAHAMGDIQNASDQTATYQWYTTRNARLNYGPTPFDQRQVLNIYWTYGLPFGRGKAFAVNNPLLERVVGGWTLGGRQSIRSGNPVLLNGGRNTVNNLTQSGVVLGSGLTIDQLQHNLSTITGYYSASSGYITNVSNIATVTKSTSTANPAYYGPASTPGQYGQFVYLHNNTAFQFDMSLNKIIRIKERWQFNFQAEALNVLNHPFFPLGNTSPTATNFGQITSATGTRTVQLRGSLEW
jgi:hypothetical protein